MRPSVVFSVGVAFLLASSGLAVADPAASKEFMRVFGLAQPPYGFVNFCERSPRECAPGRQEEQRFDATPERFAQLEAVNRAVNHEIEPVTDIDSMARPTTGRSRPSRATARTTCSSSASGSLPWAGRRALC